MKRRNTVICLICVVLLVALFGYHLGRSPTEHFTTEQRYKTAAVYNVWDGLELLPYSLRQMCPFADEVIIVTQTIGNNGVHDEEPRRFCESLKQEFPRIHVEVFNPKDAAGSESEQRVSKQIQKRNRGVEIAESLGCNIVMFMDTDEIIATEELRKGFADYLVSGKNTGIVLLKTYIRKPTYAVEGYDKTAKIALFQQIGQGQRIQGWSSQDPIKSMSVDMERTMNCDGSYYVLNPNVCLVHHFSHVRKDYEKKLNAHAATDVYLLKDNLHIEARSIEPGKKSQHFDAVIEEVPNRFGIQI